jgi:uncharacterized protein (TIGR02217 family)
MTSSPSTFVIPSLSAHPDLLPVLPGQRLIARRAPLFSTGMSTASSGRERRRQRWAYPIWEIDLSFEVVRERPSLTELSEMYAFFCNKAGAFREFFFYDPYLPAVSGVRIGTGNGSNRDFQLLRVYSTGAFQYAEPVRGVLGSVSVLVSGSPVSATVGPYGLVTLATAPSSGAAVTWSGVPLTLVRFVDDTIEPAQMTYNLWSVDGVKVRTVKR